MKKKIIILLSVVIILLMGIVVWFNIPLDLMDLDPNEVMEIVVFNGNSGNATHITDKEQIQHIVENLNGVEVKRSKPSLGYMGYSFKVTTINEQISNFAQTYPTNLKASSNEALLFMRRYRFANCSCFSCCFKDAYPSSNVQ